VNKIFEVNLPEQWQLHSKSRPDQISVRLEDIALKRDLAYYVALSALISMDRRELANHVLKSNVFSNLASGTTEAV